MDSIRASLSDALFCLDRIRREVGARVPCYKISATGDFAKILFFPERRKGLRFKIRGDIKHADQPVFRAHKKLLMLF